MYRAAPLASLVVTKHFSKCVLQYGGSRMMPVEMVSSNNQCRLFFCAISALASCQRIAFPRRSLSTRKTGQALPSARCSTDSSLDALATFAVDECEDAQDANPRNQRHQCGAASSRLYPRASLLRDKTSFIIFVELTAHVLTGGKKMPSAYRIGSFKLPPSWRI